MLEVLISALAFLLTIIIIVTFHELGHFWVARLLKVKVLRFSVGFGKILYTKKSRAGIDYCFSAVPLGGYVKMLDEREGPVATEELPYAFNRQSVWKRIAIVLAGPFANFLLAIILFTFVFRAGMEGSAPIVGEVIPDSYAQQAGLLVHDEVFAVNNHTTPTMQSVHREIVKNIDQNTVELTILRDGVKENIVVKLPGLKKEDIEDIFKGIGFDFSIPPLIGEVAPDMPAELAGMQAGDLIVGMDDIQAPSWSDMVEYVKERPDTPMTFVVRRNGETLYFDITTDKKVDGEGFIGVYLSPDFLRTEKLPLGLALEQSARQVAHYSIFTFKIIYYMVAGQMSWENVSGPGTIAQVAGTTIQFGFIVFINFLAILSVSLGVINLLPIPMLDGGHLLYYVIEIFQRKPVSEKTQAAGLFIGLMILVSLFAVAIYNDVLRLM